MPQILSLLTAFGLGSVISAIVQAWLSQRSRNDERRFKEKQAAYIGLLEAYHRAAVEQTGEASKAFAYWQMRCELVGSTPVLEAIQNIVDTNDNKPARAIAHEVMKKAMRTNLGVAR